MARQTAIRACAEKVRRGGLSLYMQQRAITIDDTLLRSAGGSENVVLVVFESICDVAPLISEFRPSIAVIDPVNGTAGGWSSKRRLASDLFEIMEAAKPNATLILLCEMTEWNGACRPRHYGTIRRFCDGELEVVPEDPRVEMVHQQSSWDDQKF